MNAAPANDVVTDLLVAGGGVAGVAAALAAARRGCRVTLVEREEVLGGTATLGMLGTICGLYPNGGPEPGELLNGGICAEIVAALSGRSAGSVPCKVGKVFVLPYDPRHLQELLTELCSREPTLTLGTGTLLTGAECTGGRVGKVTVRHRGEELTLHPRAVVDATGDGELAALAGAEFDLSPPGERQLAGLTVLLDHVGADDALGIRVPFVVARGIDAGILPELYRYTTFTRGMNPGEGALKVSLPAATGSTPDEVLSLATKLVGFLSRELAALATATIRFAPTRIFDREGRRVAGDYRLTADDILAGRKFSDGVVRGAWPMELWGPLRGASYRYPPDNDYYEIPLRCLKARDFTNLFTAGRCISVSHEALGSTRVIGCCIPLGEQAGLAAARLCSEA